MLFSCHCRILRKKAMADRRMLTRRRLANFLPKEILEEVSFLCHSSSRKQNQNKNIFRCSGIWVGLSLVWLRVAEVARERGWHPPKSLDLDENFKPEHMLFCRELRLVAIYALYGVLWSKKVPFWVKNSVSWARSALLHGVYCIFYWVKFAILRLRAKTTHLSRKL